MAAVEIEERTHSREALKDSEARYRRLFEAAQDGILILDATTGAITDANPFLVELLGYSHAEFLGMSLWDIGLFKDVEESKNAFRELKAKLYIRYDDMPLKTRGGRQVNVEFVSNVYGVNSKKVIQCNIRDITERKDAQQQEERLRKGQKMEAVGQLAGGLAHDFNNLLGVILGYCEILEKQPDLTGASHAMIVEIHNAGTSAKNLTQGLLAFSRRQVLQPVFLNLNETVKRMDTMLGRLIGDDIQLKSILQSDLGTIKADPSQLEQVLMNLVINARDAMPNGGKIVLMTSDVEIDDVYARQHPPIKPGEYVLLTVTDTGSGMDLETQSRIFEPFFSTKAAGRGTGLGLSTVFGIVKQSEGSIAVYSEMGKGTTFKIHFPRRTQAPTVARPPKAKAPRGGTETILLVDDASSLRKLTRLLLEKSGYTVVDSGDSVEALRIAADHKGPLPLMITDVVMPRISGSVLASRMSAIRPETKVLYISGYADDETVLSSVPGTDYSFLQKPFSRDALVRKVRELLDSTLPPVR